MLDLDLDLTLIDKASNIALKAFLTMPFTVCTENPIENVKSYGLNSNLIFLQ